MSTAFTLISPCSNPRARSLFPLLFLGVSLAAAPAPATSQSQQAAQEPAGAQVQVRVELVRLAVSVSDARGLPVGGLKKENFRVRADGVEQPITFFGSVEAPAQALVLVETSPAVYLLRSEHIAAAGALLDGLAPDDRVALASYDQEPHLLLPLTADKAALARALFDLRYGLGSGQLNFYDAVSAALDWLAPVEGKKALILLTTGLDTGPSIRWDALLAKLRTSEVTIFPVALGGELRVPGKKKNSAPIESDAAPSFERADREFETLAQITGGRAYFPRSAGDFAPFYRQLAATLRQQYLLAFELPARDGRDHSLTVEVDDSSGLPLSAGPKARYRVSARTSYRAPAPE